MQKIKILLLVSFVALVTIDIYGQEVMRPPKYHEDGVYKKENTHSRKPVSYPTLREADVMWSKRVWRTIDLREKINFPLYYPDAEIADRKSLFDVIIEAATKTGTITCFAQPATDDEFHYDMTKSEVEGMLVKWDSTHQTEDPNSPGTMISAPTKNVTSTDKVWQYWVKEDWFFDKQRSVLDVRIIGLCPLIEKKTESGESTGASTPLFWIYFPDARPIFANNEVYMRHNDAERRTFEDIFYKRMFSSYVRKESNVYDRGIYDYKTGLDQLLESERVKNDIFIFEHDLFHF